MFQQIVFINNKPRTTYERELTFNQIVLMRFKDAIDMTKYRVMVPTSLGKLKMIPLKQEDKVLVRNNMMIEVSKIEQA